MTFFFLFPFSKGETDGRLGMIGTSSVMEYAANCWAACLQRGATAWDFWRGGRTCIFIAADASFPAAAAATHARNSKSNKRTGSTDRPGGGFGCETRVLRAAFSFSSVIHYHCTAQSKRSGGWV